MEPPRGLTWVYIYIYIHILESTRALRARLLLVPRLKHCQKHFVKCWDAELDENEKRNLLSPFNLKPETDFRGLIRIIARFSIERQAAR